MWGWGGGGGAMLNITPPLPPDPWNKEMWCKGGVKWGDGGWRMQREASVGSRVNHQWVLSDPSMACCAPQVSP